MSELVSANAPLDPRLLEVLVCPDKRCDAPVVRIKDPDEPRLVR